MAIMYLLHEDKKEERKKIKQLAASMSAGS
jgi:hypothetical protein